MLEHKSKGHILEGIMRFSVLLLFSLLVACGGASKSSSNAEVIPIIGPQTPALVASAIDDFSSNSGDTGVYPDAPGTEAPFNEFIARYPHTPCDITPDNSLYGPQGADPLRVYQWYLEAAKIPQAWDLVGADNRGYQGEGIIVQINDSALQNDHEDLAANVIPGINVMVPEGHPNRTNPYHSVFAGLDPECFNGAHGTNVAGIIAAVGGNQRGIIGIASKAEITTANLLAFPFPEALPTKLFIDAFAHEIDKVAVSSNSWGSDEETRLFNARPQLNGLLDNGLVRGFGGKGISYVFSAGNSAVLSASTTSDSSDHRIRSLGLSLPESFTMSTYYSVHNHPGAISICAVDSNNMRARYSAQGSDLWLCGYSQGNFAVQVDIPVGSRNATDGSLQAFMDEYITNNSSNNPLDILGLPTTGLSQGSNYNPVPPPNLNYQEDCATLILGGGTGGFGIPSITVDDGEFDCDNNATTREFTLELDSWPNGTTTSYSRFFGGTSAAAPVVAGVVALIRAANPALTWRDVKVILADSAALPPVIATNSCNGGAKYSDSSGKYCHNHSYGFGIVDAEKAVSLAMQWNSFGILDNSKPFMKQTSPSRGMTRDLVAILPSNNTIDFIEYVQVEIDSDFKNFGLLDISLVKRNGPESSMSWPHSCRVLDTIELPELTIYNLVRVNAAGETVDANDMMVPPPYGGGFVFEMTVDNGDGTFSDSITGDIIEKINPSDRDFLPVEFTTFPARPEDISRATTNCPDLAGGFTFGSAAFLGMEVAGTWELKVVNTDNNQRVPVDWRMIFYGHNME